MKNLFKKFWDYLLYITNNEKESRHEQLFDVLFFFVNTIGLIFGIYLLTTHDEPQWIPFLIIEYSWALDNMRHNRP